MVQVAAGLTAIGVALMTLGLLALGVYALIVGEQPLVWPAFGTAGVAALITYLFACLTVAAQREGI